MRPDEMIVGDACAVEGVKAKEASFERNLCWRVLRRRSRLVQFTARAGGYGRRLRDRRAWTRRVGSSPAGSCSSCGALGDTPVIGSAATAAAGRSDGDGHAKPACASAWRVHLRMLERGASAIEAARAGVAHGRARRGRPE